ncbi:hypothetical protein AAF143_00580 [Cyanobium sp. ATX-6F1]|uniref:hypothetical protein n=1 Tax=Cyanobium sp. ATX 6F1 TaxID=2823702 RepID=UPI0020CE8839|nr:hypothetical protein [Cyanobium sp. ATX 6F1]
MRPISFATPTKSAPSFLISGASTKAAPELRLDQINSRLVIQAARRVLFQALDHCFAGADVCGVVLNARLSTLQGRIVFDPPVLLPDEQFVPIELIWGRLGRGGSARLRLPRKPSSPKSL